MSFPTVIVEVGFAVGASTSTYLHLDDAARGKLGTGKLAPDEVWTDITAYVVDWSTRRGASRVQGPILRYEPGTATILLKNDDRRFDPSNLSGPYVTGGATLVLPMVAVRIRALHGGTYYDVWRGYADGWPITYDGPNSSRCTLTATDGTKVLTSYDRQAAGSIGAGDDTGARIDRVLNSVSWSDTDRVLDTGDTTLQATTLAGNAWTEMQLATDTEFGELYLDAAGRVVFRRRQAVLEDSRSATSQATFDDDGTDLPYRDVHLDYDDVALINQADITRVGGAVQTATNATSIAAYLTHTHERSDLLMQTDAAALDYAQWLVYQGKDPELRFDALTLSRHNTSATEDLLFAQILGRELGDRITVRRNPPGGGSVTSRDGFIRGIEHTVTPEQWITKFSLQSATRYSFLVLDHATQGALDSNSLGF